MSATLTDLFSPKSIAVVGASRSEAKLGHKLMKNVLDAGFTGEVVPINPAGGEILGRTAYKSLAELGQPVDLCLISIPNEYVVASLADAAAAGVKTAVVLSSGFGEAGEEGRKTQQELAAILADSPMRLIGPNCMGLVDRHVGLNASYFWDIRAEPGAISFISQSGAYGGILFREIAARGLGLSKFVSIGNQLNVEHADILELLADDEKTGVIALFVEQIKDGTRFIETAARAARNKPVIVFKAGRTEAGDRAALSHTGSLAGSFEAYRAALTKAGVLLFTDTDAFFDAAAALSHLSRNLPKNDALGIMTISGGPCVAASDRAEELGLNVPAFTDTLQEKVRTQIPAFGASSNPVDMTPQIDPANYGACVREVYTSGEVGGLLAINVGLDSAEFGRAFVEAKKATGLPTVAFVVDAPLIEEAFAASAIPIFPTPERAVAAYKAILDYKAATERLAAPASSPAKPARSRALVQAISIAAPLPAGRPYAFDEHLSKQMLQEYGLPIIEERLVGDVQEALAAAQSIGYPVVLKVCSPDLMHKTDVGGVALNLTTDPKVREAFLRMEAGLGAGRRYLVQKMAGRGREILIGGRRDDVFGQTITLGLGGSMTELIQDSTTRICPIDLEEAEGMLDSLRGSAIFGPFRGAEPVDRAALAKALVGVSNLLTANERIMELDVNPVVLSDDGLIVVDGLIIIDHS